MIKTKSQKGKPTSSGTVSSSSFSIVFLLLTVGTLLFGTVHISMLYACNPQSLLFFSNWLGITTDTSENITSIENRVDDSGRNSFSASSDRISAFHSSSSLSSTTTVPIEERTLTLLQKQAKQLISSIMYHKSMQNSEKPDSMKGSTRSLKSSKAASSRILTETDIRKVAFTLSKTIINKIKHKNSDTDDSFSGIEDIDDTSSSFLSGRSTATNPKEIDMVDVRTNYPFHTQQTCYIQADESEFCTYEGIFCFDGVSPIVIVDKPSLVSANTGGSGSIHDKTDQCTDIRYIETTASDDGGCSFDSKNNGERTSPHMQLSDLLMNSGSNSNDNNDEEENDLLSLLLASVPTDTSLSLRNRRWGPLNRGPVYYREMTVEDVHYGGDPFHFSLTDEQRNTFKVTKTLSSEEDDSTNDIDTDNLHNLPKLRSIRRTESNENNFIIDWIDDPLWIVGLEKGAATVNPYVWMTHMGGLFDGQRSNATGTEFGSHSMDSTPLFMGPGAFGSKTTTLFYKDAPFLRKSSEEENFVSNNSKTVKGPLKAPTQSKVHNPNNYLKWLVGAQWDVPSMDYLFFTGPGSEEITNIKSLGDWYKRTLLLSIQTPVTKVYFKDAKSIVNSKHLVCSTKGGAVPGQKFHFFNGRGDASLYRQYSYIISGLAERHIRPHPLYPPRKITVFDSTGPYAGGGFVNQDVLIKTIHSTGLPYEIIPDIDELTFDSLIELMSSTGILIAPHGVHLAKTIPFLPSHAVVIDCFPYLTKNIVFQRISNFLDLHYFPLFSLESLSELAMSIDNFNDLVTKYPSISMEQQRWFWEKCLSKNITSYESKGIKECSQVFQTYPIYLDPDRFERLMRDAVDGIAAYSTRNPAWKKIIQDEGIVPPSPPPWITTTK